MIKLTNLIILVLITLLSCNKANDLSPIYGSLIGKWERVNGNEDQFVEFLKNGRINQSVGLERSFSFIANSSIDDSMVVINNSSWGQVLFGDKKVNSNYGLRVFYNNSRDTINLVSSGGSFYVRK